MQHLFLVFCKCINFLHSLFFHYLATHAYFSNLRPRFCFMKNLRTVQHFLWQYWQWSCRDRAPATGRAVVPSLSAGKHEAPSAPSCQGCNISVKTTCEALRVHVRQKLYMPRMTWKTSPPRCLVMRRPGESWLWSADCVAVSMHINGPSSLIVALCAPLGGPQ